MADDLAWIYWVVFGAYLVYMLIAGIRAKEKSNTLSDFLVAGRNIGPLLMGLSLGVTYFSASLLIGAGTYAGRYGLGTLWIGAMNAVLGVGLFTVIFGNRTRAFSAETNCLTVPEMLGTRYQSKGLQLFTALVTFVFEILYLVAVYMGLSSLFSIIMPGLENAYGWSVLFCGVITIVYIVVGGSQGAIATDLIESLIMLAGVLILLFAGMNYIGGFPQLNDVLTNATGLGLGYTVFPGVNAFALVGYICVSSIGIWGSPQMISRYFTAKNKRSIKGGLTVSLIWASLVAVIAYLNGCIALAYNVQFPLAGLTSNKSNLIPLYMLQIFQEMPWLGALFLAAVAAASLTTEEKIILVSASAISRDFYQTASKCSDEKALKVTRVSTILIVAIAVWISVMSIPEILVVTFFAFSTFAAAFLIPYFFGLYWKGGTKAAAITTSIICTLVNIIWWFGVSTSSGALVAGGVFPYFKDISSADAFMFAGAMVKWGAVNEFFPSMIIGLIIFPIISKFTKKPDPKFVEDIFTAMKGKKEVVQTESAPNNTSEPTLSPDNTTIPPK